MNDSDIPHHTITSHIRHPSTPTKRNHINIPHSSLPSRKSSQIMTFNLQFPGFNMEMVYSLKTDRQLSYYHFCQMLSSCLFYYNNIKHSLFNVPRSQSSPPSWYFTLAPPPKLADMSKVLHSKFASTHEILNP